MRDDDGKRCGTCRHWQKVKSTNFRQGFGHCRFPWEIVVPIAVKRISRNTTHNRDGRLCPTWEVLGD